MSFIQALLETGRRKGDHLVQLDTAWQTAMDSVMNDASEMAEIFNLALCDDDGFKMQVQPRLDRTGSISVITPEEGQASKTFYIDLGYSVDSDEYCVTERGTDLVRNYREQDMKIAVAQIVLKHLPDRQYLKLYRALQMMSSDDGEASGGGFTVEPALTGSAPVHAPRVAAEQDVAPKILEEENFTAADDETVFDEEEDAFVDMHLSTEIAMR